MNRTKSSEPRCIESALSHADQNCLNSGKRLTAKRRQVLSVLLALNKAASAYDIMDRYEQNFGVALPAMSIYRILDFLEEVHLVHKLRLANKYVACSHINCSATHEASQFFICSHCGKVKEIEINAATFEELKRNSIDAGFDIERPQLEINCICTQCC